MNTEKIPTELIKESPYRDRLSYNMAEWEHLIDMPVDVVDSQESNMYIVIKNISTFKILTDRGEEEILCNVIQTVATDEEAYILRAAHVLEYRRPFDLLEQAMCILECSTSQGIENFYQNGGDRRSDTYKKESLLDILKERFPYNIYVIDILKRLGHSIGHIGIEGLYGVICNHNAKLTLRIINKKNSMLKQASIISQIKSLIEQGKEIEDIKQTIGQEIYDILFDSNTEEVSQIEDEHTEDTEDEDCDYCDLQLEHNDPTQKHVEEEEETEASHTPKINQKCGQLSELATEKVKSCFKPFFDTIEKIRDFLDSKTIINEDDAGRLHNLIEDIQKYFTNFMTGLYAGSHKQ